ncbi:nicotinate-nicotinamide nucleotide adenylyltransferase [Pseudoalteromonas sp. NBT06-2]|uniref:nicotinate-nucleotide adenylyltransferase n=1 Tax=Pseudoalteromonas sp. NBT06-2 TaxID=2025950 RepID=UPI000BA5BAEA|nr:nicotinate-nucleotide adenylyltransferase [Pseudoalteromonas sp. NBT06-2]PAJ73217.1 nicotinate-nicotinamide nucleotide adenylyltransferase [Pseudoalteromonas sp. NBT06-2]
MIGIFGGTFDPIHLGHLNIAKQCVKQLHLDKLYFMPCATPVHKSASNISSNDRAHMVNLAIKDNHHFALDDRELRRTGASYSVLSLRELKQEFPEQSILFLIGMDSLNTLNSWYQWQEITQLCHLIICKRPRQTFSPNQEIQAYLNQAATTNNSDLNTYQSGKAYFLNTPEFDIASSEIRQALMVNSELEGLLPDSVLNFIKKNNLYSLK